MTNLSNTQMPGMFIDVIDEQLDIFDQNRTIQDMNGIPDTQKIPITKQTHWIKIPDVVCVYVDMKGSTQLSATNKDKITAGAYQLFTGTAVRLFDCFESPYIDVRGDGVFALFNRSQEFRAIAAAITFKTFAEVDCIPRLRDLTGSNIGTHIGIDQKTVLVRKIGLKRIDGRSDRQNEVWAGKPINMASKLASLSEDGEILVSDRFFKKIQHELVIKSCGCPDNVKKDLWYEVDLSEDPRFDFTKAHKLKSRWCKTHGLKYCDQILRLD